MTRPYKVSSEALMIDVNVIPPQVEAASGSTAAMADDLLHRDQQTVPSNLTSYLGLSFAVFLGLLPESYQSHLSSLHHRSRALAVKLLHAEEQLRLMKSRRQEDSKANARVVEIFASHRHAWQAEEKRLLQQLDAAAEEAHRLRARTTGLEKAGAELRAVVEKLQREVEEREEVINFVSRRQDVREEEMEKEVCISHDRAGSVVEEAGDQMYYGSGYGRAGKIRVSEGLDPVPDVCFSGRSVDADQMGALLSYQTALLGRDDFFASSRSVGWRDVVYDANHDSLHQTKHFMSRRESPWKVDGESKGIASKLKALEQELVALEKVGGDNCSRVPSLLRKQATRYQTLTSSIDDLCQRMQASDPSETTLSSEFRTQRQTEFLLEAFRLQQRAVETNQKLTALHAETKKSGWGDENLCGVAKLSTRRSVDCVRNHFREIQRNMDIWLARIMGDLEGILARDGASRVSDYYIPKYSPISKAVY